mmetsp:Transcript_41764/g.90613  ORF Transcript_41764/g.90613 Transcript_41764/m.90613 type:complete len:260 (+) Transcript_41764:118-897(+)
MLHEFRIGRLATSQADKPSARKGETKLPTLDLNKPLVWQTQFLGDHYNTYIHRPQHLKGGKSARFFHSDFLEFHSRTPWYYIPSLWIPVICLLLTGAHLMFNMSLFEMGPYMGTGFVLWSLIEYLLHRFLFHMPERIIHCNRWVTMLHFLIHGCHHLLPMDPMRLVFPPIPAAIISCGVYSVFRTIVTTPYAMVMLAGSLLGYISYDLTHYYLHHASVRGSHFRTMKTYHLAHHYKNPNLGFGISSMVWDVVFGTTLVP